MNCFSDPTTMALFSSPYFPHALYSLACLSISVNFLSLRRTAEEEKARIQAQISILESIKEQLQAPTLNANELERLKKLAKPTPKDIAMKVGSGGEEVKWSDVFRGQKPATRDEEVSKWDQQDLEKSKFSRVECGIWV